MGIIAAAIVGSTAAVVGTAVGLKCAHGGCKRSDVRDTVFHVLYKADKLGHLNTSEFAGSFAGMVPTVEHVDDTTGTGSLRWQESNAKGNVTGLHSGDGFVLNGTFSTYLPGDDKQQFTGKLIKVEVQKGYGEVETVEKEVHGVVSATGHTVKGSASNATHVAGEVLEHAAEGLRDVADAVGQVAGGIAKHESAGEFALDVFGDMADLLAAVAHLAEKIGADPAAGDAHEKGEEKVVAMRDAIFARVFSAVGLDAPGVAARMMKSWQRTTANCVLNEEY